SLAKSLTFHAGFEGGFDAAFSAGDRRLHTASMLPPTDGQPGNRRQSAVIVAGGGRHGDALRFEKNAKEVVYYPAAKNFDWRPDDWSGTFCFWMKLTPEEDLQPGFADPIQITDKKWDDASFFFDFSKDENPRHFRLGVFSDLKVWNPKNTPWEQIPVAARPMVVVEKPPFRRDRWTHVAATWSHYNTGREDAEAAMYLDGKLQGKLKGRQTIGWDPDKTAILLGLSYIGDLDDLAVFNRALSSDEVKALFELPGGVADLHR
ncbi:MAG: LamG domain-containing protein, partial [Planctomycetaceae bacterium]